MSQFHSNSKSDRDKRITRFAFSTMDVPGQGFIDKVRARRLQRVCCSRAYGCTRRRT